MIGVTDTESGMLVRRDGSLDLRVLGTRLAAFAGVALVAAIVGAAVAVLGS